MSPLLDVQTRYRELGRIRLGEKGAKGQPQRRSEFRLTSASTELLTVAQQVYGGTLRRWDGAPTEGAQYELLTGTDRLDVLVPPGEPLTQHWEMWSGGGCTRRCNGVAQQTGEACACPSDIEKRIELSKKGQACRPTTRLSVVLPRIPDIGVWRVESHGMNSAVELPGTVAILEKALASGVLVPAQLRLDQRTAKKDGQTRHFVVPVLELPTVTTEALMSAEGIAAIGPAHDRPALPSPRQSVASAAPPVGTLPAGRGEPPLPPLPNEVAQQAGDSRSSDRAKGDAPHAQPVSSDPASRSHVIDAGEGDETGSPAAVASSPDPVLADDLDRASLKSQVEALPADLARTALRERKAAGIPALGDAALTKADVAAIEALLLPIIKEQSSRSKKLVLVLKKAGLEADAERHALIAYATDNRVSSSKKVTEEDSYLCLAAAADMDDGKLVMHVGDDGAVFFLPADLGAEEVAT